MWQNLRAEVENEFRILYEESAHVVETMLERRRARYLLRMKSTRRDLRVFRQTVARGRKAKVVEARRAYVQSCALAASRSTCACGARLEHREGLARPLHLDPVSGRSVRCLRKC